MSPSQSRKHRGYDTQRLVAAALRADGFPYAEPIGAGTPGRDITGTPGLAIEVKARAGFDPLSALRQAAKNAGDDVPIAVLRMNGQGPATVDEFVVCLRFSDARRLLRAAGYGTPPDDPAPSGELVVRRRPVLLVEVPVEDVEDSLRLADWLDAA